MFRQFVKLVLFAALLLGGGYGLYRYERDRLREAYLQEEIRKLQEEKQQLQAFVKRLVSERRVAEIIVTKQEKDTSGNLLTSVQFLEYDRGGQPLLPPKEFRNIRGNILHIDALVIKFDHGFIEKDDAFRGHSLSLFYRIYGEHQVPVEGMPIYGPDHPPNLFRSEGVSPAMFEYERKIWKEFWRLMDEPAFRKERGVRVAQGESVWSRFYPDVVYTVSLEAAGGLNLRSRPIQKIAGH